MEPIYSKNGQEAVPEPTTVTTSEQPTTTAPETEETQQPQKKNLGELVRKHWMLLVAGFAILLLLSGFLYLRSLARQAEAEDEPLASATSNIDQSIPEAATASVAPPAPSDVKERQRQQELQGNVEETKPSADQIANSLVIDTVGQAEHKRQEIHAKQEAARQRAIRVARAQNVDTVVTTVRDPATGSYQTAKTTVPRRARSSSYSNDNQYASSARSRNRSRTGAGSATSLPATDIDGVPFETNPDVLAMLEASPQETRQSYEKMTGRRYRPLGSNTPATTAKNGTVVLPDGFNTIKLRATTQNGSDAQNNEESLVPDVFFKAVINGEQNVRTGSVVMLRLLEDAVVSGTTFPKNMVFAGVADVSSNNVNIKVDRLGPTRVKAQIYDFNYMPGIMIDPGKRAPLPAGQSPMGTAQQAGFSELSSAIDRSYSAANSAAGIAARVGAAVIQRAPRSGQKLRPVLLPDGYPILITTGTTAGARQ